MPDIADTVFTSDTVDSNESKPEKMISENKFKKIFLFLSAAFLLIIGVFIVIIVNLVNSQNPESSKAVSGITDIDSSGFIIFKNNFRDGFFIEYYSSQSLLDFFSVPETQGDHAIHWSNVSNLDCLKISFTNMDLNYFVQNGYVLEFKAKTESPVQLNVKFTHIENEIYWHVGNHWLARELLMQDGKWHTIRIPLEYMHIWGGTDGFTDEWHNPDRISDYWVNIIGVEFDAQQEEGITTEIYFNDIRITR